MSILEINNLSFSFDNQERILFDNTSFRLDTDWKLGLVGRNGRGKTTLLKILREELDFQGGITKSKDISFSYFPEKIADKEMIAIEALQAITDIELWRLEKELRQLEMAPELLWVPFRQLSGGEQTKVLLAFSFLNETDFPLIDEPTNHLDIVSRKIVADYLKKKNQGFIVVSHDTYFLDEVIDHVMALEKHRITIHKGNYRVFEEEKQLRDNLELMQNEKLKKEITRLRKTAREKELWSQSREGDKFNKRKGFIDSDERGKNRGAIGADAARTMKRAKAIEKRAQDKVTEKEGLLKDIERIAGLSINYQPSIHKHLIKAEDIQFGYDQKPLTKAASFEVNQGDIVAFVGPNGVGKSTLLALLKGDQSLLLSGELHFFHDFVTSFVDQDFTKNTGSITDFSKNNKLELEYMLNNLKKLGLERDVFQTNIEKMSMGQRKKVEMAKSLVTDSQIYYWDEPLNYLDTYNQDQLTALIQETRPTMIIVDHNLDFLRKIDAKLIMLEPAD